MSGPSFNQNHSGSGDNVVNYGVMPFQLTQEFLDDLVCRLDRGRSVNFNSVGGRPEHFSMAASVQAFLNEKGFDVAWSHSNQFSSFPPHARPLSVSDNQVVFDPS